MRSPKLIIMSVVASYLPFIKRELGLLYDRLMVTIRVHIKGRFLLLLDKYYNKNKKKAQDGQSRKV